MGLTVRPYLAIINLSVATGFRTPILFGRLPTGSLYSLEKLIEWKRARIFRILTPDSNSLLARERNRMETRFKFWIEILCLSLYLRLDIS